MRHTLLQRLNFVITHEIDESIFAAPHIRVDLRNNASRVEIWLLGNKKALCPLGSGKRKRRAGGGGVVACDGPDNDDNDEFENDEECADPS